MGRPSTRSEGDELTRAQSSASIAFFPSFAQLGPKYHLRTTIIRDSGPKEAETEACERANNRKCPLITNHSCEFAG